MQNATGSGSGGVRHKESKQARWEMSLHGDTGPQADWGTLLLQMEQNVLGHQESVVE